MIDDQLNFTLDEPKCTRRVLFKESNWRLVENEVSVAPDRIVTLVFLKHLVDKLKLVRPELEPLDEPDAIGPSVVVLSIAIENFAQKLHLFIRAELIAKHLRDAPPVMPDLIVLLHRDAAVLEPRHFVLK